eukprot:4001170-Alexandrium_andersonii.AAC.1
MALYKGFIAREATRRTQMFKLKLDKKVRALNSRMKRLNEIVAIRHDMVSQHAQLIGQDMRSGAFGEVG